MDSSPSLTMTLQDVARAFHLSESTIRRHLKQGTLPIKPLKGTGRRLRWSTASVFKYLSRPIEPYDGRSA